MAKQLNLRRRLKKKRIPTSTACGLQVTTHSASAEHALVTVRCACQILAYQHQLKLWAPLRTATIFHSNHGSNIRLRQSRYLRKFCVKTQIYSYVLVFESKGRSIQKKLYLCCRNKLTCMPLLGHVPLSPTTQIAQCPDGIRWSFISHREACSIWIIVGAAATLIG